MIYQVMPDLTPMEYEGLKASISEVGVLVPVELDEDGNILDGHHRVRAWTELRAEGVDIAKYATLVRRGMTEEQKRNHARVLNVNRRHLNKEQRDSVMRDMRADGATYKEIAQAVGVGYATAYRATAEIDLIQTDKVTGADGKQYPATYARKPEPPPTMFDPGGSAALEPKAADSAANYAPWEEGETMAAATRSQAIANEYRNGGPLPLTAANHAVSADPDYDGDEWYTPTEYIEAARQLMGGIDLDPASSAEAQEIVKAGAYFTKRDDGLSQPWMGCVWLNPPYSTPAIKFFVAKLISEYQIGNVTEAVILTNNSSDTAWFHDLLSRFPACFTRGRVQFWRANHETFGARQGQTLFYLGDNLTGFRDVFSVFGAVVVRV